MAHRAGVDPASVGFDPLDPSFIASPYPVYEELRARGRIHYDEAIDHWLIPWYDDVDRLLRDRRFGRTYHHLASDAEMGRPQESAAS